jgi:hypothetical protein
MSVEYGFLPGRRLSPAYKESSLKPLNDPFSLAVACLLSDVVRCADSLLCVTMRLRLLVAIAHSELADHTALQ